MSNLALLATFWAAFFLALISPGPSFALVAGTALREGRRRALRTAIGLAAGEAAWACAAVFGVSALAAQHPFLAAAFRIGGGAFLLFLGLSALWAVLRNPARAEVAQATSTNGTSFWRGFSLMLLNPKAGVFWVSLSSLFLGPDITAGLATAAVAGAVLLSMLWHCALAWVLSTGYVARLFRRIRRGIDAVFGVVMAALGVRLILSN
ncbi:LysE family translocator [Belnapia sp. T18]|uniref:LysE family translocator n=1 Tax=Belnapia arida TaxID=2804533 RepID=A0ABS1UCS2_9PROT|nr:LysE family translocator [Belnapia arida]MBL6082463.1 LysE family translocator [Belnapia arida]